MMTNGNGVTMINIGDPVFLLISVIGAALTFAALVAVLWWPERRGR